jgi:hypothetical protein
MATTFLAPIGLKLLLDARKGPPEERAGELVSRV